MMNALRTVLRQPPCCRGLLGLLVLAVFGLTTVRADAQVTPPNVSACDEVDACEAPRSICSAGGFEITLKSFTPAASQDSGTATYTYEICSPAAGTCSIGGGSCLDNNQCGLNCVGPSGSKKCAGTEQACTTDAECAGTCSRECAVQDFRDLSHFDVVFPELGGLESCLSATTGVSGTCACSPGSSVECDVDSEVVLGDGACFDGQTSPSFVAKCNDTTLSAGDCITMTLEIAGESAGLGLGAAIVVDKEAQACTASCLAGPSCEPCLQELNGSCLTRTAGFWGTHPEITGQFLDIQVCGQTLDTTQAGGCTSVTEALCVSPGRESVGNAAYAQLVRQLAAAKLNLAATLASEGDCGGEIAARIAACEALCNASQSVISASGCIEDLDEFNNSQDTLTPTPSPFERPGRASPTQCQLANGNGILIGANCAVSQTVRPTGRNRR
jgi:hypothetical protein